MLEMDRLPIDNVNSVLDSADLWQHQCIRQRSDNSQTFCELLYTGHYRFVNKSFDFIENCANSAKSKNAQLLFSISIYADILSYLTGHWEIWTGCNFEYSLFNFILLIVISRYILDNALRWLPQDLTDDESKLVQIMAWASVDPDLCHHMASLVCNELNNH